eukprot:70408-Prymnesium_polylepis.1
MADTYAPTTPSRTAVRQARSSQPHTPQNSVAHHHAALLALLAEAGHARVEPAHHPRDDARTDVHAFDEQRNLKVFDDVAAPQRDLPHDAPAAEFARECRDEARARDPRHVLARGRMRRPVACVRFAERRHLDVEVGPKEVLLERLGEAQHRSRTFSSSFSRRVRHDDHARALLGERSGAGGADAARAARDDDQFAGQRGRPVPW